MKILCCADIHITEKIPRYRKSEYTEQLFKKLNTIAEMSNEKKCDAVLIAGDIFDTANPPYSIYSRTAEIIKKINAPVVAVPGQHDLRWHTTPINDTPFGGLVHSGLIEYPDPYINFYADETKLVSITGMGWNSKKDNIEWNKKAELNILLTHRMVTKSGPLYPQQNESDFVTGKRILEMYPQFDIIVSGDNHETHSTTINNRIHINPGSMMRKRKDQAKHIPVVFLITDSSIQEVPLECLPSKEVFDFEKIYSDESKEESKEITKEFLEQMKSSIDSPEFLSVLKDIIEHQKPSEEVLDMINEKIDQAKKELEKHDN